MGRDGINGELFFNKGFGLTMTLRVRFCKRANTTTNHRMVREHIEETRRCESHISVSCLLQEYPGQVVLSLKMKDRHVNCYYSMAGFYPMAGLLGSSVSLQAQTAAMPHSSR
jgi:hypothetical protein